MWPQYVYLAIVLVGLGVRLNDPTKKIEIGFGTYIVSLFITFFLLGAGGFFDGLLK